ncbi:hypothetical protein [Flavobacterium sp.]|uniref:hypothetical protein n=1 Tax=Flavobacterium sp. TaxID=239 RepID=UPI004047425E
MKKIFSLLVNVPKEKITNAMIRIVFIDLVTFLIGFTMFFGSLSNIDYRISEEGITYGVILIVLGILTRLWRKEFKEDNL